MRFLTALMTLAAFIFASCGGDTDEQASKDEFRQTHKSPEGALIVEHKMQPRSVASAFLINRERAIFLTADHFTDMPQSMGIDDFKIAFEGNMYNITTLRAFRLFDASVLYIRGEVDSSTFPPPYRISREGVEVGDTVFIRGVHPHPDTLQQENRRAGHAGSPVRILEDYYQALPGASWASAEYVHDNLKAVVEARDVEVPSIGGKGSLIPDRLQRLRGKVNRYFTVRTEADHRISFGGLSGGPAVNRQGEVVGIVTGEPKPGCDIYGRCDDEVRTLIITPITSITEEIEQFLP